MNAPGPRSITINLGEATVTVPAELAALAYIEKMVDEATPLQFARQRMRFTAKSQILDTEGLPPIGADWNGGKYAGLTIHGNAPYGLVLLPGGLEEADWKKALAWCEEQGGLPPSRFDHLVMWQNLRSEFKPEAYWSGEERAVDPDYAWYQSFYNGNQNWDRKSLKLRVVAVRRVAI